MILGSAPFLGSGKETLGKGWKRGICDITRINPGVTEKRGVFGKIRRLDLLESSGFSKHGSPKS